MDLAGKPWKIQPKVPEVKEDEDNEDQKESEKSKRYTGCCPRKSEDFKTSRVPEMPLLELPVKAKIHCH